MTFGAPFFFWTFLALIPLAIIYFLKVRPRKKTTPAYFLWEKIFTEKKAQSLFNRLRDLFSLLLMILAFSAIAMALTRPSITDDERKDLLIVIDHSASMSATEGSSSRLQLAQDAASDIALAINDTQRAAVASVAHDVIYHSHLSNQPRELLDAIEAIQPSDYPLRASAIDTILQDENWAETYRMLLFTDGNFDGIDELPESIEIVKLGETLPNIGIVAADLQRVPGGPNRVGFWFRVHSSHEEEQTVDLTLTHADTGQIVRIIPLTVAPGENESQTFLTEDAQAGNYLATIETQDLEVGDSLEKDNTAYLSLAERRPIRTAVLAEDRFFLETAVNAFERSDGLLTLDQENPQITLSRADAASQVQRGVLFNPMGESPWWQNVGEELELAVPKVLLEDHPVLRYADVTAIPFRGARQLEAPDGALILVESDTGVPLIYTHQQDGRSVLVYNLDPLQGEFYFSAWFPVLIHGSATHLAGRVDTLAATYRPGSIVPIPGNDTTEEFTIYPPGHDPMISVLPDESIPITETGTQFGPIQRLGTYSLETADEQTHNFGTSLMSQADSFLDNETVENTSRPISKGQSPSYWLLVIALFVLVGESILYHRRKVG